MKTIPDADGPPRERMWTPGRLLAFLTLCLLTCFSPLAAFGVANLAMVSLTVDGPIPAGNSVAPYTRATVTIQNTGDAASSGFGGECRLYLSSDAVWDGGDSFVRAFDLRGLAPGEMGGGAPVVWTLLPPGNYYLIAVIFPAFGDESNPNNAAVAATVVRPDLAPAELGVPSIVVSGTGYYFGGVILTNSSEVAFQRFDSGFDPFQIARLWFSADSILDSGDWLLGDAHLDGAADSITVLPHGSSGRGWRFNIPEVPAGDYFFIVQTDPLDQAIEANEGNNVLSVPVTVLSRPFVETQPTSVAIIGPGAGSLSVSAVGTPPFTYQWFKNGTNIAGQTNSTLLLSNAVRADSGLFSCIISNAYGYVASSNALVTIRVPQLLRTPQALAGDAFRLLFGDADGAPMTDLPPAKFEVQSSSDLEHWSIVTNPISVSNGLFQVDIEGSSSVPHQFFRVVEH